MSRMTLKSRRILTEGGFVDGYLTVEDGLVAEIASEHEGPSLDASDLMVCPGIIDLHNHGFGGWSITDPCADEDIRGYADALAAVGVTGVLPTTRDHTDAYDAIVSVMEHPSSRGARILGLHSEGPFWARGGENTVGETWPMPDLQEAKRLVEAARGAMRVMALAPELPGAHEVIRYLHGQGIKAACCHTAAKAQDIYDAQREVGLDIATHLGNGMRGIHHRDVGALGALLLSDNLFYEVITDLNHICPDMLRLMFRLRPYERFCLISDSNFIAGLPAGTYLRYGREMVASEKGLILNSDGRICGSGSWVLKNVGQLVRRVGVPAEEAFHMASLNPARFLGIADETGSLRPGKRADLILVDDDFACRQTYVGGSLAFDRSTESVSDRYNPEAMSRRVR